KLFCREGGTPSRSLPQGERAGQRPHFRLLHLVCLKASFPCVRVRRPRGSSIAQVFWDELEVIRCLPQNQACYIDPAVRGLVDVGAWGSGICLAWCARRGTMP